MHWNRRHGLGLVLVAVLLLCPIAQLRAAEIDESSPRYQAFLLWQKGYVMHVMGAYEAATELFQRSIDVEPTAEGHTFLGWSLSHLGQTEEAIAECEKAIALDPDYGNPYNDIGVYLIELGRPDEAVPWLEKAMRAGRYCCYQYPHFNLGRILVMKGQIAEAEQAFEKALSYDRDYLPAVKALELIRGPGQKL